MEKSENPSRKTAYDLIAVRKGSGLLINIDSQAPNRVVREWLETQEFTEIIPEYTYGNSRIDFYMKKGSENICWRSKAVRWKKTESAISRMCRQSGA